MPGLSQPLMRRDSEAALVRRPGNSGLLAPLFLPLLSLIIYQHNVLLVFWLHDRASIFMKWRGRMVPPVERYPAVAGDQFWVTERSLSGTGKTGV